MAIGKSFSFIMNKNFVHILFFFSMFAQAQEPSVQLIDDTNYIYRSLSAALVNPDIVFRLNLSKHKLKEFPADIFKFKNLRELDLSHNKIDSIPAKIGTLYNLQRLNL